jgi:hypothetical protein
MVAASFGSSNIRENPIRLGRLGAVGHFPATNAETERVFSDMKIYLPASCNRLGQPPRSQYY